MGYARGTSVPVEKSRMEVEKIVKGRGATDFTYAERTGAAMVQFKSHDRMVRFILPLPTAKECSSKKTPSGKWKPIPFGQQDGYREQLHRERWRALKLAILAKLEAVDSGIEQFEESFLGQIVDPATNRTVYELLKPDLQERYLEHGNRPLGLPAPEGEVLDAEFTKK